MKTLLHKVRKRISTVVRSGCNVRIFIKVANLKNINTLSLEIWERCVKGDLKMKLAPSKALFYTLKKEFTDDLRNKILEDQAAKKEKRVAAFESFVCGIEAGKSAEELVKAALDI